MASDAPAIGDWIDPRHLSRAAISEARRQFDEDLFGSVVLDGFLRDELLAALRACFGGDAQFMPHYGLIDRSELKADTFSEESVSADVFDRADDSARLACELVMDGWAPGKESSVGWRAHVAFTELLLSADFRQYLGALTGIEGIDEMTYMPRIMRRGDFCRLHDDTADRRRLCMLFYVDDGWQPGFGGHFQHVVDGHVARNVSPIGNRVLIHEPRTDRKHQVEAFSATATNWERWTYSIWYNARP